MRAACREARPTSRPRAPYDQRSPSISHELTTATTIVCQVHNASVRSPTPRLERVDGVPGTTECVHVLRTDASSCRGAPTRTVSQPLPHTGRPPPDGHAPDALDPPPPQHLSPPEAWRLRDGGVPRAHDVQPHVDEVCSALTWRPFLGCNCCSPIVGAGTRGIIVRRPTIFRQSLVASTTDRRTQSPRQQDRHLLRISAPAVLAALANPVRQYPEAVSDPSCRELLRPNTLSVGVRRTMILRSTLVTVTTQSGKPCISFSLNTTAESDKWWLVVCRVPAIQGG